MLPSGKLLLAESVKTSAITFFFFQPVSAREVGLHRRRFDFTCAHAIWHISEL